MNRQEVKPAFFVLKAAQSYKFWNRNGQSLFVAKKGEVFQAKSANDIAYFRARPDVLVETDSLGRAIDRNRHPSGIDPSKTKSFRTYAQVNPQRAADAVNAERAAAAASAGRAQPVALPANLPAGAVPIGARGRVATGAPHDTTPNLGRQLNPSRPESPIEYAQADGSTTSVNVG